MEYVIRLDVATPDLERIVQSLREIDPASVVDADPLNRALRLSATMLDRELLAALAQAGYPARPEQIERLPSSCCGGCGG